MTEKKTCRPELVSGPNTSLHEMLKLVQHDRKKHVVLNSLQDLIQVLHEMLKLVQHDRKKTCRPELASGPNTTFATDSETSSE